MKLFKWNVISWHLKNHVQLKVHMIEKIFVFIVCILFPQSALLISMVWAATSTACARMEGHVTESAGTAHV